MWTGWCYGIEIGVMNSFWAVLCWWVWTIRFASSWVRFFKTPGGRSGRDYSVFKEQVIIFGVEGSGFSFAFRMKSYR